MPIQYPPNSTGTIAESELISGVAPTGIEATRSQIRDSPSAAAGVARVLNGAPGSTDYGMVVRQAGSANANPRTGAAVALSSAPVALTAGADTVLTFASAVQHVLVQNKTPEVKYIELDATASPGTILLPANSAPVMLDVPCAVLHVYGASASTLNGTTATNFYVKGFA